MLPIIVVALGGAAIAKAVKEAKPKKFERTPSRSKAKHAKASWFESLRKYREETVELFSGDRRTRHMKDMAADGLFLNREETQADQMLSLSNKLVVSTMVCSVVYPPLLLLHVPVLIYNSRQMVYEAVKDLKELRVTTVVIDTALSFGTMAYSPFHPKILVIGCLSGWLYSYTFKLTSRIKDSTRKNFTHLMGVQPKSVWKWVEGEEIQVPFNTVQVGDYIMINAGDMIPLDGTIDQGSATIDQRALTGEAQPAEKGEGEPALAGTMVLSGRIRLHVERTGEDTAAAQIGQMLLKTADFTSSVELKGKELSDKAALPTLLLAGASLPIVGPNKALAILFSGVGYNMRILGPLAIFNFLEVAATKGILIKDGRALEHIGKVDMVVFDKTGTLTQEQPSVAKVHVCNGYNETELLTWAAAAEHRQTHPIARAILKHVAALELELPTTEEVTCEMGYGIKVQFSDKLVRVGSQRYMTLEQIAIPEEVAVLTTAAHDQGNSLVFVAVDDCLAGVVELHPTVRPEAKRIIASLHEAGIKTCIISGDHERPTRALAKELGIDSFFAETLPEDKANLIGKLQEQGRFVCFIGDGINDAIALKKANVSISLRGATTAATDTAQIIMMDETLNALDDLFQLSRDYEANLKNSLMTTVVPGTVIIVGAFAGVVGFASSLFIFSGGMIVGLVNSMLPRYELKKLEK